MFNRIISALFFLLIGLLAGAGAVTFVVKPHTVAAALFPSAQPSAPPAAPAPAAAPAMSVLPTPSPAATNVPPPPAAAPAVTTAAPDPADAPTSAQLPEPIPQSELFYKYTGSQLLYRSPTQFTTYNLIVLNENKDSGKRRTQQAEGSVTRFMYAAAGASSHEVSRNYEEYYAQRGYKALHATNENYMDRPYSQKGLGYTFCKQQVALCGGEVAVFNNKNDKEGITAERYIVMHKTDAAGTHYIAVMSAEPVSAAGLKYIAPDGQETKLLPGHVLFAVDYIEPKALIVTMSKEDAGFMAKALAERGRVDLYGIYFDFNKSDIKHESEPVLEQIAQLLGADPSLSLTVAGHTDNVGGKEYNDKLSQARADAVVNALMRRHGIAAARLTPQGKGFSEPKLSNDTEEGRAKNRRVELVKRP